MPSEETDHAAAVGAWLSAAGTLRAEQLLDLFDRGVRALWQRAQRALGEVTLTAIADRVIHVASAHHPLLSGLKIEQGVVRADALHSGSANVDELLAAVRFVLVELLTVLGSLTAEILTPALHAELATVTLTNPDHDRQHEPSGSQGPASEGSHS
jgi:hypothetical protein